MSYQHICSGESENNSEVRRPHAVPDLLNDQRTKKVVQANNPERLGIAWLRLGDDDFSVSLLLEYGLIVVETLLVEGNF